MKPIKYTQEGDRITYHYTFKQLREFLTHGFKEGNNGMRLIGEDKHFYHYRGFGTIENPSKYIASLSMEHDPMFDGKRNSPEDYIKSFDKTKEHINTSSHMIEIWDIKNYK